MSKELKQFREESFKKFAKKVNNMTEDELENHLFDQSPENAYGDESLEEKRKLVLELEYNYIQQASKEDLLTLYK